MTVDPEGWPENGAGPPANADRPDDYQSETGRDLFVYSGPIGHEGADLFADVIDGREGRSQGVGLFLSTYGGDADAAFRIARALSSYEDVRLLIAGRCKSAGTNVALAAHEIAFGHRGELGPLDVQLRKPDEIFSGHSGLDTMQALAIIQDQGYDAFRQYVVDLAGNAGISTLSAMQIAVSLVSGLFEPIAAQIDPQRLGEAVRAISVANDYGSRLATDNVKPGALDRLVSGYSTHSFVIDKAEAESLFENVDTLTDREFEIAEQLEAARGIIHNPSRQGMPIILDVCGPPSTSDEPGEVIDGNVSTGSSEAPDRAEPRGAGTDGTREGS